MYKEEGRRDKLEEYLGCPVIFNHDRLILVFDKTVLDLPIVTGNKEMLAIFEDYMNRDTNTGNSTESWLVSNGSQVSYA